MRWKCNLEAAKAQFIDALPTILFFLFLFYTIIAMFGVQYVIAVSFMTTLFKVKRMKKQTPYKLAVMAVVQLSMGLLAFVAAHYLIACIVLNLLMPFILVLLQSSQFNQKGYFSSAMGFVFLQLKPIPFANFTTYLLVLAYGLSVIIIALLLSSFRRRKKSSYQLEQQGMVYLQTQMLAYTKQEAINIQPLQKIQRSLYKLAYQSRGLRYMVTKEGKLHYMFALLFQRSCYFLETIQHYPCTPAQKQRLQEFDAILEAAQQFPEQLTRQYAHCEVLMAACEDDKEIFSVYIRHFLQLYQLIITDMLQLDENRVIKEFSIPQEKRFFSTLWHRLALDSFEFRFAARLSLILSIGFLYAHISGMNHGYWLVLNSFLLLQPMMEDSAHRLKTRFLGTIIGCTIVYLVMPLFPGLHGHFLFATIMVIFLYATTPGTWLQAIFSTCFAISLATLAMQSQMAIELRLLYVVCAILLVLVVNRFFFPTSKSGMFQSNIAQLFHLQHSYLRLLQSSLHAPLDYGLIMDGLTQFHMVFDQILEYLHSAPALPWYDTLLQLFWRMVAEMEQMLFLVHHFKMNAEDEQGVERFIQDCDAMLQACYQHHSSLPVERSYPMTSSATMKHLMQRYMLNIHHLYHEIVRHTTKEDPFPDPFQKTAIPHA